jgi:hypothetical protein
MAMLKSIVANGTVKSAEADLIERIAAIYGDNSLEVEYFRRRVRESFAQKFAKAWVEPRFGPGKIETVEIDPRAVHREERRQDEIEAAWSRGEMSPALDAEYMELAGVTYRPVVRPKVRLRARVPMQAERSHWLPTPPDGLGLDRLREAYMVAGEEERELIVRRGKAEVKRLKQRAAENTKALFGSMTLHMEDIWADEKKLDWFVTGKGEGRHLYRVGVTNQRLADIASYDSGLKRLEWLAFDGSMRDPMRFDGEAVARRKQLAYQASAAAGDAERAKARIAGIERRIAPTRIERESLLAKYAMYKASQQHGRWSVWPKMKVEVIERIDGIQKELGEALICLRHAERESAEATARLRMFDAAKAAWEGRWVDWALVNGVDLDAEQAKRLRRNWRRIAQDDVVAYYEGSIRPYGDFGRALTSFMSRDDVQAALERLYREREQREREGDFDLGEIMARAKGWSIHHQPAFIDIAQEPRGQGGEVEIGPMLPGLEWLNNLEYSETFSTPKGWVNPLYDPELRADWTPPTPVGIDPRRPNNVWALTLEALDRFESVGVRRRSLRDIEEETTAVSYAEWLAGWSANPTRKSGPSPKRRKPLEDGNASEARDGWTPFGFSVEEATTTEIAAREDAVRFVHRHLGIKDDAGKVCWREFDPPQASRAEQDALLDAWDRCKAALGAAAKATPATEVEEFADVVARERRCKQLVRCALRRKSGSALKAILAAMPATVIELVAREELTAKAENYLVSRMSAEQKQAVIDRNEAIAEEMAFSIAGRLVAALA